MAETDGSSTESSLTSMTNEELVAYLQNQGIEGTDLTKIKIAGYNGKTIILLAKDNNERLYKLQLSDSSTAVMEDLLERLTLDQKSYSCSESNFPLDDLLPTSSDELLFSFGLGYGIDVSDNDALRNRHGKVRIILPDLSNVEERAINRRDTYEEQISTLKNHKESVKVSVSDLSGAIINLSTEAEHSRERTRELIATGEKVITRSITFKPFCSKEYQKEGEIPRDTFIEEELVKWIMDKIPETKSISGSTAAEKVDKHLQDFPKDFKKAVDAAYLFVKTERLTHYIEAIDLGAAKYTLSTSTTSKMVAKAGLEATVKKTGGGGARVEGTSKTVNVRKEDQMIGDISTVSRNRGEEVVEFKIMPIFKLMTQKEIKQVLQKAIILYLNRESGPFVISCGKNSNKYLHVAEVDQTNQVLGVDGRDRASIFYIFPVESPNMFNIAYFGRKESDRYRKSGLYLTANTRFGYDSGPLEVGGPDATEFILNHPSKDDESLSIDYWETDDCYVRLAPRPFQMKSFMAFDEESLKTVCVGSLRHEGKDNIWLRFQLRRVRSECSTRNSTYSSSEYTDQTEEEEEPIAANNNSNQHKEENEETYSLEGQEVPGSTHHKNNRDDEI